MNLKHELLNKFGLSLNQTDEKLVDLLLRAYPNPKSATELGNKLGWSARTTAARFEELEYRGWCKKIAINQIYFYFLDVKCVEKVGLELQVLPPLLRNLPLAEKASLQALMGNRRFFAQVASTDFVMHFVAQWNKRFNDFDAKENEPSHKSCITHFSSAFSLWLEIEHRDKLKWGDKAKKLFEIAKTSQAITKDGLELALELKETYPQEWLAYDLLCESYAP